MSYLMPCYHPLQAYFSVRPDGKKDICFSNVLGERFAKGVLAPDDAISLPCGKCIGCRLERSRQWALRCVHESKLYEENCFVTLTYDDEHLPQGGSLVRSDVQNFLKRLRDRFSDRKIRVFYCGEYGENLERPHYHLCLFNLEFHDRRKFKRVNGFWYYVSDVLSSIWPFGHCVVSDFSFETAAYVARYCTKVVNGDLADDHYRGRLPEFCQGSLKPGIGKGWFDKFFHSDLKSSDRCVVNGVLCKPPRYYDVLRDRLDPEDFVDVREARVERAKSKSFDSTFRRLAVREKCHEARIKLLIRNLEK